MRSRRLASRKTEGWGRVSLVFMGFLQSLHVGTRLPDNGGPARRFPADVLGELPGRAGDDIELDVGQALGYVGQVQDPRQLVVVALDDRLRRAARREEADPGDGLEVLEPGLDERRYLGGAAKALAPRRGEDAQPAVL